MESVFALVDCENFYVSCERVFDPALRDTPVAVLSNNDGCIIARSAAVKNAGVPMGAPYFQWENELDAMDAVIRSSNYALYGDMSRRVMRELEAEALRIERYSIDEAFLTLPALPRKELHQHARQLQRRVRRRQGVPIRVGIGPTKTLAKVADEYAKASDGRYVCPAGETLAAVLEALPVEEVWGIGSAYATELNNHGVETADAFRRLPNAWIRRHLSVVGLRLAAELRGTPCLPLEDAPTPRKSMIRSRSFSDRLHTQDELREAVSMHAQRAAEKLREEGLVAGQLEVFVTTKRFGDPPHYANAAAASLQPATNHTPPLLDAAGTLLDIVYREGPAYKKAGVALQALRPEDAGQGHLFRNRTAADDALMDAVDELNREMGRGTVGFAAAGRSGERDWTMKREMRSPHYTTRWSDLPVAHA